MLRALRPLVFFFSLLFVAGIARDARADTATAQALFDQGKKLMGEKKYSEACPKFEESQRLDPGLGTQYNLASCYELMGKTASAWSLYLDVASQAKATNQADREKKSRDAAKALEPKLSKLTIEVASPAAGIEVKRNGQIVGQATWGTPIPVDPGAVKVTAMAPNRKLFEKTITVDKPGETTTVKVPELEKGQTPAGYGTAPAGTSTAPAGSVTGYYGPQGPPPGQPQRMKRRSSGMFGGGIAMISVGGVLTLGGAVAGALISAVDGSAGAAWGTAGVGVALLGGGIALVVIGGKKVPVNPEASALTVSPVPEVQIGPGSLAAKWTF